MSSPIDSYEMIRKDSTMSPEKSPTFSETSSSRPSLNSRKSSKIATPWVPKVGPAISAPKKTVAFSAKVEPFRPGNGPITLLNNDSEPDVASVNTNGKSPVANIGRVMRPIGSPTRSSKSASSMHEGPVFTTEGDVNMMGGRYSVVANIPERWMANGTLENALNQCGIASELMAYKVVQEEPGTIQAVLFFDDIRSGQSCRDSFTMALTTASVKFIDHHQFFAVVPEHPRAARISAFDGQLEYRVKYIGDVREFNLDDIFKAVRAFASSFGEVRAFSLGASSELAAPLRFRVEYYKISEADKACSPGDFKEMIELGEDLLVDIAEYAPGDYSPYAHPCAAPPAKATPYSQEDMLNQHWPHDAPRRGAVSLRGKSHDQRRTYAFSRDVAPEYRRGSTRHYDSRKVPRSGIHDNINYDALLASGPEDVYTQPQTVCLAHIIKGLDCRTTIMVRNIPNKLNAVGLKEWLDETSHGLYDFSYLRVDFSNNCNVGYAFVNFSKPEYIVDFVQKRVGRPWNLYGSEKTCEISYATIQGQDCLVAKFRNSSVMREWDGFRPKVFHTVDCLPPGTEPGEEAPFPEPNNLSKLQRSLDNAQAVGLYPPRSNHRGRDQHSGTMRHSQYDKGTPRALLDERNHFSRANGQPVIINGQHFHPAVGPGSLIVYVAEPLPVQHGQNGGEYFEDGYDSFYQPNQRGSNQHANSRGSQKFRRRGNNNHNSHNY